MVYPFPVHSEVLPVFLPNISQEVSPGLMATTSCHRPLHDVKTFAPSLFTALFHEVLGVGPLHVLHVLCLFISFLNFPYKAKETGTLL